MSTKIKTASGWKTVANNSAFSTTLTNAVTDASAGATVPPFATPTANMLKLGHFHLLPGTYLICLTVTCSISSTEPGFVLRSPMYFISEVKYTNTVSAFAIQQINSERDVDILITQGGVATGTLDGLSITGTAARIG